MSDDSFAPSGRNPESPWLSQLEEIAVRAGLTPEELRDLIKRKRESISTEPTAAVESIAEVESAGFTMVPVRIEGGTIYPV